MARSKTSYVNASKLDCNLTIYVSVKNTGKLPEGVFSKRVLSYHLKNLKIESIIKKIGYGTYVANEDEWQRFRFLKQVTKMPQVGGPTPGKNVTSSKPKKNIRGHGFVWTLSFESPLTWFKRKDFLEKRNIVFKNIRVGSSVGQSFVFNKNKTWLLDHSIVIYFPKGKDFKGGSADETYKLALFDVLNNIRSLESLFGFSLKRGKDYKLKCSRNHFADVGNAYAHLRKGDPLHVSDFSGEWLLVDSSTGVPELETVHPRTAKQDMDEVIAPFFNQLKETRLMPNQVLEMVNGVAKNQKEYAENIKSHIQAIKDLGDGVKKLTVLVQKGQEIKSSNITTNPLKKPLLSLGPEFSNFKEVSLRDFF